MPRRERVDPIVGDRPQPDAVEDLLGDLARVAARSRSQPRWTSAATRMLSRADIEPKTSSRWNVRAMPSRARRCGATRVRSCTVEADPTRRRAAGARR